MRGSIHPWYGEVKIGRTGEIEKPVLRVLVNLARFCVGEDGKLATCRKW